MGGASRRPQALGVVARRVVTGRRRIGTATDLGAIGATAVGVTRGRVAAVRQHFVAVRETVTVGVRVHGIGSVGGLLPSSKPSSSVSASVGSVTPSSSASSVRPSPSVSSRAGLAPNGDLIPIQQAIAVAVHDGWIAKVPGLFTIEQAVVVGARPSDRCCTH